MYVFFFSGRRSHTRLSCDWSSDVCSADLSEEHTSELQSHDNLVCGVQTCAIPIRSEEHTSELQSHDNPVCRLPLEKKLRPGGRAPGLAGAHPPAGRDPPAPSGRPERAAQGWPGTRPTTCCGRRAGGATATTPTSSEARSASAGRPRVS